jgi:hypothetical protein
MASTGVTYKADGGITTMGGAEERAKCSAAAT